MAEQLRQGHSLPSAEVNRKRYELVLLLVPVQRDVYHRGFGAAVVKAVHDPRWHRHRILWIEMTFVLTDPNCQPTGEQYERFGLFWVEVWRRSLLARGKRPTEAEHAVA